MDAKTDLTNFWLAWHCTCSIRICMPQFRREFLGKCEGDSVLVGDADNISALAGEVMRSTNLEFRHLISRASAGCRSEYEVEATTWGGPDSPGSAFELMEAYLYSKGQINGRAFKNYLFEDIANRPGGMNRNLYGYCQKLLRTMARESYGDCVYEPVVNEAGEEIEPTRVSRDGHTDTPQERTPVENVEVGEVLQAFKTYLEEVGHAWDEDSWMVLYCVLNRLPIGGAKVRELFSRGHSAIANLGERIRDELLSTLRGHCFTDMAIGMALNGDIQGILREKVKDMPKFPEFEKILGKFSSRNGK